MVKNIQLMSLFVASTLVSNLYAANPASQDWVLDQLAKFSQEFKGYATYTAGTNITISPSNVISSATPAPYTAGNQIDISSNVFSWVSPSLAFVGRRFAAYSAPPVPNGPGHLPLSTSIGVFSTVEFNITADASSANAPTYGASPGEFIIQKAGVYSMDYNCSYSIANNSNTLYPSIAVGFNFVMPGITGSPGYSQNDFYPPVTHAASNRVHAFISGFYTLPLAAGQSISLQAGAVYAGVGVTDIPNVAIDVTNCLVQIVQIG